MPKISTHREDPVDYLLRRKRQEETLRLLGPGRFSTAYDEKIQDILDAYMGELESMDPDALVALYKEEKNKDKEKEQIDLLHHQEYEDRQHFFNQPDAAADLGHWSKATYWAIEEAIALALGKEPTVVNSFSLKPHINESAFAQHYFRTLDLAYRALHWQQLVNPISPAMFLEWALKNELPVSKELIKLVESRGGIIADFKDQYDELLDQNLSDSCDGKDAMDDTLCSLAEQNKYWSGLEAKAKRAIREFPEWEQRQRRVRKTGNLQSWLTDIIGVDAREAEILKKALSDQFTKLL